MSKTLNVRQKQKSDLAVSWITNNTILLSGEIGIESDTGNIKVGDGATAWNDLAYVYKKQLNAEELAVIENYRTWYNETYKTQVYQAKLNYLVGEAEFRKTEEGAKDWIYGYRFGSGKDLFLQIRTLEEERCVKVKEVESILNKLPKNIASELNIDKYGFILISEESREFTLLNPVLKELDIAQEFNTLNIKVGDGVTAWNDLPYYYEYDATSTEGEETEGTTT